MQSQQPDQQSQPQPQPQPPQPQPQPQPPQPQPSAAPGAGQSSRARELVNTRISFSADLPTSSSQLDLHAAAERAARVLGARPNELVQRSVPRPSALQALFQQQQPQQGDSSQAQSAADTEEQLSERRPRVPSESGFSSLSSAAGARRTSLLEGVEPTGVVLVERMPSAAASEAAQHGADTGAPHADRGEPTERAPGDGHGPGLKLTRARWMLLAFSSLGVIYGDIGTSPLYAYSSIFTAIPSPPSDDDLLGGLSLMVYALTFVIFVKYVLFVLRATNNGEGGMFALTGLLLPDRAARRSKLGRTMVVVSMVGASLLISDSVITPAISVLSAVEGIGTYSASEDVHRAIVPITVVILLVLFCAQRFGTARVGVIFAPVTMLWFVAIGACGIVNIVNAPYVLYAYNPAYIYSWFARHGTRGWHALGSVFLAVTGGEAIYADIGHFGRGPVTLSWSLLVYPFLLLSYTGQAAYAMLNPANVAQSFYLSVPEPVFWPLVVLATLATIIASQAVISAAFSLALQAIALETLPRFTVTRTSVHVAGQVYVPVVNWSLMVVTLAAVVGFGSSLALADAYGVAVTAIMVLTTVVMFPVTARVWRWPWPVGLLVCAVIGFVDVNFFAAALLKVPTGGWVPLVFAVILSTLMLVYRYGRKRLDRVGRVTTASTAALVGALRGDDVDKLVALAANVSSSETSATDDAASSTPMTTPATGMDRGDPAGAPSRRLDDDNGTMSAAAQPHPRYRDAIGVFMTHTQHTLPLALNALREMRLPLPEVIVIAAVAVDEAVPFVAAEEKVCFTTVDRHIGVCRLLVRLGFADPVSSVGAVIESFLVRTLGGARAQAARDRRTDESAKTAQPVAGADDGARADERVVGRDSARKLASLRLSFFYDQPRIMASPRTRRVHQLVIALYGWLESLAVDHGEAYGLPADSTIQLSCAVSL